MIVAFYTCLIWLRLHSIQTKESPLKRGQIYRVLHEEILGYLMAADVGGAISTAANQAPKVASKSIGRKEIRNRQM